MTIARRGDWMQTRSGKQFWPLDPREEDVDVEDIAYALAACARFAGHTRWMYSVCAHSMMVAEHCAPEKRLIGLLHDASEAYLGDLVSPFKHDPSMHEYRMAEKRLQACILRALGVPFVPFMDGVELPDEVHMVDRRVLATEVRDLSPDPSAWSNLLEPYPEHCRRLTHEEAAAWFLERWEQYRKEAK